MISRLYLEKFIPLYWSCQQMSQPSSSGKLNNSMEQLDIDSTFDGSIQVSGNTVPHNATHVYDSYNFQHQYDPKLPITHHREEVRVFVSCDVVDDDSVVPEEKKANLKTF